MKKLRGRRRHLRRAEWWQQLAVPLAWGNRPYDYRKIWLRPWSDWFFRRQPPTMIRRALLAGLLRIHAAWLGELRGQLAPYYLAVWLFEQPFSQSQVVAATGERIAHYESVFVLRTGTHPLPPEYRAVTGVDQLDWQTYVEIEADYDPPQRPVRGYRQERAPDGQLLHVWERARVWVGRAKAGT